MATSTIKETPSRMTRVSYDDVSLSSGYCQITYPDGYYSNDIVIIQPIYNASGIMGWTATLQLTSSYINMYIRQGTTQPANGSRIRFDALFIKRA